MGQNLDVGDDDVVRRSSARLGPGGRRIGAMVPGLLLKRRIGLVAVGLGFIAASSGLIGVVPGAGAAAPQAKPTTTTGPGGHSTTTWNGNGTTNGFCDNSNEGLSGVPAGDQGWLFVLTSPNAGPWELTATFASTHTVTAAGTQNGNGSVHFEVTTSAGDKLLSASSTNGGHNLVVSGCTLGASTTTTTVCPPYGPCTQPTTVAPTTVVTKGGGNGNGNGNGRSGNPVTAASSTGPSSTAFTGADLALMFTIGAIAIGVGGVLVLVSRRRRRSAPAYVRDRE